MDSEGKQKVQRACDHCRRRRVRCEEPTEGGRCARCIHFNLACTFETPRLRRGPIKAYISSLEARIQKIENVLQQLSPESSKTHVIDLDGILSQEPHQDNCIIHTNHEGLSYPSRSVPNVTGRDNEPCVLTDSEDDDDVEILEDIKWLREMGCPSTVGYHGKSSGAHFLKKVFELRNQYLASNSDNGSMTVHELRMKRQSGARRTRPWEPAKDLMKKRIVVDENIDFPEHDLFDQLIDNYFHQMDGIVPLLNETLFRRQISERLHYSDTGFAVIALLVAAIGTRLSDDPRVFCDIADTHSRGWMYFSQAQRLQKPPIAPVSLYDIQAVVLTVSFLHGSSAPESGWSLLGSAIRLSMDVGAHRRKFYGPKPTVYTEQWKRAFWVLVQLDRHLSIKFGKQSAIRDEDFDLDPPIECDDEYWFTSDPDLAFKQPQGKPCFISCFIHYINHLRIIDFVMRTIHSINKSKLLMGPQRRKNLVMECDAALNAWKESLPDHLRWERVSTSDRFYNQSAALEVLYYQAQIIIHRPFVTSSKPSLAPFPSMTICTNAARSTSRVLRLHYQHIHSLYPWIVQPAFVSGVMLLLHVWRNKKDDTQADLQDDMEHVYACMRILKLCENAWRVVGQQWDTLFTLASSGSISLLKEYPPSDCSFVSTRKDWHETRVDPSQTPSAHLSHLAGGADICNSTAHCLRPSLSFEMEELTEVSFSRLLDAYATSAPQHTFPFSEMATTSLPSALLTEVPTLASSTPNMDWALYAAPPLSIGQAPEARRFPYNFVGTIGEEMGVQETQPINESRALWTSVPSDAEMASWDAYISQITGLTWE